MMSSLIICTRDQNFEHEGNIFISFIEIFPSSFLPVHPYQTMSDAAPLLSPTSSAAGTNREKQKPDNKGKYNLGPSRIRFPASSTSALYDPERAAAGDGEADEDPDLYDLRTSGYRPTPVRDRSTVDVRALERETRPGLPKLSRECLWS